MGEPVHFQVMLYFARPSVFSLIGFIVHDNTNFQGLPRA